MKVRVGVTRVTRESQIDELGEVKKEEGEIRCLWTRLCLETNRGLNSAHPDCCLETPPKVA